MKSAKKKIGALLLAAALSLTFMGPARAVRAEGDDDFATQDQLDELAELQKREADLAKRERQLENDMAYIRQEVSALQSESAELDVHLNELKDQGVILDNDYQRLTAELQAAKEAMNLAVADYDLAVAEVNHKQAEYEDRLVAMYKRSRQSKLEVLLSSDGLTGFFTNLELLGVIGRSDRQILEELTAARETAEVKKQVAENSKKQYEIFVAEKAEEIKVLAAGIASAESEISELQDKILNRSADLNYYSSLYTDNQQAQSELGRRKDDIQADIKAQAEATRAAWAEATRAAEEQRRREEEARQAAAEATRRAEAEATRRAAEAAAEEAARQEAAAQPQITASGMAHPAPGNRVISSYYGWRAWPLNPSRQDFHTGIDFPGYFNDPVVAALDGTVISVSYPYPNANYGGWGLANSVIIQHDNGLQTVYGHLKTIIVSPGQRVSRGERIGGIGSTGYSTGPHLHFEIRQPGNPNAGRLGTVDPYPYLFG